jgi:hypothetical protein
MMRKKSGKQVGLSRQKMTSPRDSTVESEPAQKTEDRRTEFLNEGCEIHKAYVREAKEKEVKV